MANILLMVLQYINRLQDPRRFYPAVERLPRDVTATYHRYLIYYVVQYVTY